jgi:hypothetical protein
VRDITLTADEELIEAAEERARAEGTTLNEQFQRWLEGYSRREQKYNEAMELLDRLQSYVRIERMPTRDERSER